MTTLAFNCLHVPADSSTEARLLAVIATDRATTKLLRHEAWQKMQDVKAMRIQRRWAESALRRHRRGEFDLPEPRKATP